MNLAEVRHGVPMYIELGIDSVRVRIHGTYMGNLYEDSSKVYFEAICEHEDAEYAKRDKFLSFFTYTRLITFDGFYRETIYELHGFKNDIR